MTPKKADKPPTRNQQRIMKALKVVSEKGLLDRSVGDSLAESPDVLAAVAVLKKFLVPKHGRVGYFSQHGPAKPTSRYP